MRTASLRAKRYSEFYIDRIVSKPDVNPFNSEKRIVGRPKAGWGDDYEKSGRHFSRRKWHPIVGSHTTHWMIYGRQERRFGYMPAIPWSGNPAYLDESEELVFEFLMDP